MPKILRDTQKDCGELGREPRHNESGFSEDSHF
jgi:hypothetical protein